MPSPPIIHRCRLGLVCARIEPGSQTSFRSELLPTIVAAVIVLRASGVTRGEKDDTRNENIAHTGDDTAEQRRWRAMKACIEKATEPPASGDLKIMPA